MSKALFEMEQEMAIINNYPPDFKMQRHYRDYLERRGNGGIPIKRSEPLTDAEREEMAINFARVDAFDKRNRGQEFED
jgi:hypothetical protein